MDRDLDLTVLHDDGGLALTRQKPGHLAFKNGTNTGEDGLFLGKQETDRYLKGLFAKALPLGLITVVTGVIRRIEVRRLKEVGEILGVANDAGDLRTRCS